jgi:hypothetical protein
MDFLSSYPVISTLLFIWAACGFWVFYLLMTDVWVWEPMESLLAVCLSPFFIALYLVDYCYHEFNWSMFPRVTWRDRDVDGCPRKRFVLQAEWRYKHAELIMMPHRLRREKRDAIQEILDMVEKGTTAVNLERILRNRLKEIDAQS